MADENPKPWIAIGQQPDLEKGWAIIPFYEKPHFWVSKGFDPDSQASTYRSACGLQVVVRKGIKPLVVGNFPKCKRCKNIISKGM